MRKQIITGLAGALLGSTALTGVAVAQVTATSGAAPTFTGFNIEAGVQQDVVAGSVVTGMVTTSGVVVANESGVLSGDVIVAVSGIDATGIGNDSTYTIGNTAGARRAIGAPKNVDEATISGTVTGGVIGVVAGGDISGDNALIIDANAVTANARGNQGVNNIDTGGLAIIGDAAAIAADASVASADGEIAIAAQDSVTASTVSSAVGDTLIGVDLDEYTASNTGGITVSGNDAAASTIVNSTTNNVNDEITGSDIDIAVATGQSFDEVSATSVANAVQGAFGTANGSEITGMPVVIEGNDTAASTVGNQATNNLNVRPGAAGDEVLADTLQSIEATTNPTSVTSVASGATGAVVTGGDMSDLTATISGNSFDTSSTANSAVDSVAVDVGGVGGDGVGTTVTQNVTPAGAGAITVTAQTGEDATTDFPAPSVFIGLGSEFSLGSGGGTITGSDVVVEGNSVGANAALNSAEQSLGGIVGNIAGAGGVGQALTQTVTDPDTITLAARSDAVSIGIANTVVFVDGTLTIADNDVSAGVQANVASVVRGEITGEVTAAVTQSQEQATTNLDGANNVATVEDTVIGPDGQPTEIGLATSTGDVDLIVADNDVSAQFDLNSISRNLGTLTGTLAASTTISASGTQSNNNSNATSIVSSIAIGVAAGGSHGAPLGDAGGLGTDLTVADNTVNALARGNTAVTGSTGNALTGTSSGTILVSDDQSNTGGIISASADASDGLGVLIGLIGQSGSHAIDRDFSMNVTGNGAGSSALGNVFSASLGSVTGSLGGTAPAGIGANVVQANTTNTVDADTENAQIGVNGTGTFVAGPAGSTNTGSFNISGNSLSSTATANLAITSLEGVTGTITDGAGAGNLGVGTPNTSQTNTTVNVNADTVDSNIGFNNTTGGTGIDGTTEGAVILTVADNSATAAASGNIASALLGDFVGDLADSADYGHNIVQLNENDTNIRANVDPILIGANNIGVIAVTNQMVDLVVSGNSAAAQAIGNSAAQTVTAFIGTADGTSRPGRLTTDQDNNGSSVTATNDLISIGTNDIATGIAVGANASAAIEVANNTASASASLNNGALEIGRVVGSVIGSGALSYLGLNQANDTSSASATLSNADLGANDVGSIATGGSSTASLTVVGNAGAANASGNSGSVIYSEFDGTATAPTLARLDLDQVNTTATISASNENSDIGVADALGAVATGPASTAALTISENALSAGASGNAGVVGLLSGSFTGTLAASSSITSTVDQTNNGDTDIDAQVLTAGIGVDGSADTATADASIASIAVTDNVISGAASGNSNTTVLGELDGTISGGLSSTVNQTNTANTDIDSEIDNALTGIRRDGSIATAGVAALTVADNVVQASTVGNANDTNIASIVGTLAGTISFAETQANTIADGIAFSATNDGANTGIGLDGVIGLGTTPTIADNATVASLVGNQSTIDVGSLVQIGSASLTLGGSQTNTGVGGITDPDATSLVTGAATGLRLGTDLGRVSIAGPVSAVVDNNNQTASVVGNLANRVVADLGGVISSGSLTISDEQTNSGFNSDSTVEFSTIGVNVWATGDIPVDSIVNNNSILATNTGNAQQIDVTTAGLAVGGTISLGGTQLNTASSITSSVAGSTIGAALDATGTITGTSIVRGGSIGASSVGNSATSRIGR